MAQREQGLVSHKRGDELKGKLSCARQGNQSRLKRHRNAEDLNLSKKEKKGNTVAIALGPH